MRAFQGTSERLRSRVPVSRRAMPLFWVVACLMGESGPRPCACDSNFFNGSRNSLVSFVISGTPEVRKGIYDQSVQKWHCVLYQGTSDWMIRSVPVSRLFALPSPGGVLRRQLIVYWGQSLLSLLHREGTHGTPDSNRSGTHICRS